MEHYSDPNLKIFALSSNRPLAAKIAEEIGLELWVRYLSLNSAMARLKSTSMKVYVVDHVYIVQSTSFPVNDNLMELLIMVARITPCECKNN